MRVCKICNKSINKTNKYALCKYCYFKSPEKKLAAKKCVQNRKSFLGELNPNYKGKTRLTCNCKKIFYRRISPSQVGTNTHKYCSKNCKYKYAISKTKIFIYKNIKFRSSWEVALAKYFDENNYTWIYEPQATKTPYGFYTPDFWVKELNYYFEVKGHFQDEQSKLKFIEFSKNNKIILADILYFNSLGFTRVCSGANKGQLWRPQAQY